jgi:outer membrane lipoprotein-sorting protein
MKFAAVVMSTLLGAAAWSQSQSTTPVNAARDRLRKVADTYRNLNTFEWTALVTTSTDSGDFERRTIPITGLFRRPGSMRVEQHGDSPPSDTVAITNGGVVWLYYRQLNGFCRPNPNQYFQSIPHYAMLSLGRSLPYESILDGMKSARLAGNSVIRISSADVRCVLVTVFYAPKTSTWTDVVHTAPVTYWIDEKTNIVMQQSSQVTMNIPGRDKPRTDTTTTTLIRYRLNPKLKDSRFTFQPPQRTTERSCFSFSSGG